MTYSKQIEEIRLRGEFKEEKPLSVYLPELKASEDSLAVFGENPNPLKESILQLSDKITQEKNG